MHQYTHFGLAFFSVVCIHTNPTYIRTQRCMRILKIVFLEGVGVRQTEVRVLHADVGLATYTYCAYMRCTPKFG